MCVCVCVYLCLREDVLAGPHNFKSLFEGKDLVLKLGLKLGLG